MKKELSIIEKLQYSTTRIIGMNKDGVTISGTGFFFNFTTIPNGMKDFHVVITNRHVVEEMEVGKFIFTLADENKNPSPTEYYSFDVYDFKSKWIYHPDSNIDLCVFPIMNYVFDMFNRGISPYYSCIDKSLIPTTHQLEGLDAIEDIIMIGYPNGLWDETNNQPIIRRGITATHPNKDYMGRKEFLADIAAYPGSSGSPIFINNTGMYYEKRTKSTIMGSRLLFLGILYAGPTITSQGEIKIKNVPTNKIPFSEHRLQMNLGMIIKSEMIYGLEKALADYIRIIVEKYK